MVSVINTPRVRLVRARQRPIHFSIAMSSHAGAPALGFVISKVDRVMDCPDVNELKGFDNYVKLFFRSQGYPARYMVRGPGPQAGRIAALPVDAVNGIFQRQRAAQSAVGCAFIVISVPAIGHLRNLAKKVLADKWQGIGVNSGSVTTIAGGIAPAKIKRQAIGYT